MSHTVIHEHITLPYMRCTANRVSSYSTPPTASKFASIHAPHHASTVLGVRGANAKPSDADAMCAGCSWFSVQARPQHWYGISRRFLGGVCADREGPRTYLDARLAVQRM